MTFVKATFVLVAFVHIKNKSAVTDQILTKLIARFLRFSLRVGNCHGDICPPDIWPCPCGEYLNRYWPNFTKLISHILYLFIAATSSSRSNNVTLFFCLFVCLSVCNLIFQSSRRWSVKCHIVHFLRQGCQVSGVVSGVSSAKCHEGWRLLKAEQYDLTINLM